MQRRKKKTCVKRKTGPSITQCLGLSVLSSIVATLGPSPASSSSGPSGGADERNGGGGGGLGGRGSIGCLSEDEKLMKELQGAQVAATRTRLYIYLCWFDVCRCVGMHGLVLLAPRENHKFESRAYRLARLCIAGPLVCRVW